MGQVLKKSCVHLGIWGVVGAQEVSLRVEFGNPLERGRTLAYPLIVLQ